MQTPAGLYTVRALLDDQELDSRAIDRRGVLGRPVRPDRRRGRRVGRGYLEMTGYAQRLKI